MEEDEPKDEVVVEATIGTPGGPEHGNPNVC
jgi:hypothetical protein